MRCTRCAQSKADSSKGAACALVKSAPQHPQHARHPQQRRRGAAANRTVPLGSAHAQLTRNKMIAFEDTVVDRESELDWETLVTSTTAVANEPAPVSGAVSSGVPIVNAIGRGTAAVGGAAWQSQVTFGTQQRPVDPRAPVVQDGREGKLFLGGITWATDEDAIREYFGRFGGVVLRVRGLQSLPRLIFGGRRAEKGSPWSDLR